MKKDEKEYLKKEFTAYLEANNLITETEIFGKSIYIRKNVKNKKQSDYHIDDYLFVNKMNLLGNIDSFMNFLSIVLRNKERQHLVLEILLKKEGTANSYGYYDHAKLISSFLEKNSNLHYQYICRSKFLKNIYDLKGITSIFNKLNTQEQKEGLIDTLFTMPSFFDDIDKKLFLKELIDTKILNKKKYINSFPEVKVIDNESEINIFDSCENEDVLNFFIDEFKIAAVNKNKNVTIGNIRYNIETLFKHINKEKVPQLNITSVDFVQPADNKLKLSFFGKPLNELKVKLFCNYLIKECFTDYDNDDENYQKKVDTALIKAEKEYLSKELNQKTESSVKRMKI